MLIAYQLMQQYNLVQLHIAVYSRSNVVLRKIFSKQERFIRSHLEKREKGLLESTSINIYRSFRNCSLVVNVEVQVLS